MYGWGLLVDNDVIAGGIMFLLYPSMHNSMMYSESSQLSNDVVWIPHISAAAWN